MHQIHSKDIHAFARCVACNAVMTGSPALTMLKLGDLIERNLVWHEGRVMADHPNEILTTTQADKSLKKDLSGKKNKKKRNPYIALGAVVGALVVPTALYFGYDLMRAKAAPCDAIFQHTALTLSTKIKFLKTSGEVQLGREKLTDLGERAQMTALNLKTCCTVLHAGRVDPEQFLQCKAKSRAYDSKIDDLVGLVKAVLKHNKAQAGAMPQENKTGNEDVKAKQTAKPDHSNIITASIRPKNESLKSQSLKNQSGAKLQAAIVRKVEEAQTISKQFNQEIVQVEKARALAQLKVTPPKNIKIAAQEREPNNDALNTNEINLNGWITSSIAEAKDADYFVFTTPDKVRDWIVIEIENRSTTYEPMIKLYNSDKVEIGSRYITTAGANLRYRFVSNPNTKYYLRVSNYYGKSVGSYLLRVKPSKAQDKFEPNQTILAAKEIELGGATQGEIMDGKDIDFFMVKTGSKAQKLTVSVENQSAGLHPYLLLYNSNKSLFAERRNTTPGADLQYQFEVKPGQKYYLRVSDYYSRGAGKYSLTFKAE